MKIVQKNAFKVVGIKVEATWEELWTQMPQAWDQFIDRYDEIDNRVEDNCFMDISVEKKGELYTQFICTEVTGFEDIPTNMEILEVPSQKYIFHQHRGTLHEIASSFGEIYAWAEANGHDARDFKIDRGYTPWQSEREHELFVKIVE